MEGRGARGGTDWPQLRDAGCLLAGRRSAPLAVRRWAGGVAHRRGAEANGRAIALCTGSLVSFPGPVAARSVHCQRAFICRLRDSVRQQKQGAGGAWLRPLLPCGKGRTRKCGFRQYATNEGLLCPVALTAHQVGGASQAWLSAVTAFFHRGQTRILAGIVLLGPGRRTGRIRAGLARRRSTRPAPCPRNVKTRFCCQFNLLLPPRCSPRPPSNACSIAAPPAWHWPRAVPRRSGRPL